MNWPLSLDLAYLRAAYRDDAHTPSEVIRAVHARIQKEGERPVWISTVPLAELLERAKELENRSDRASLPLYGVPFAVKDNIDAAGIPTTAGCPGFAHTPTRNSTVVQRLLQAGAILMGKTNLDQFATGLVGVRSPFGACSSVFNKEYISGGSSSGSAVAVAKQLVSFALGTDTAGSGRVPAAFNGLVGLKPTRGVFPMTGVVPACRSLDCVTVLALNPADARAAWLAAKGLDKEDGYSREPGPGDGAAPWLGSVFRFGVPRATQLEFFGDGEASRLYQSALGRLEAIGGRRVEIDFAPFRAAADLLYAGPWVAERLAALEQFFQNHEAEVHPVVRQIITGARKYSAVDAYRAAYKLEDLKRAAAAEWAKIDVLALPTTGTIYKIAEVEADPLRLNTNLGYYTNFVNLMDLAAVAVPAGLRPNGLPFGITLIGPAFTDEPLLALASHYLAAAAVPAQTGCVRVAVVGAHLQGQPLNHELTSRGARLVRKGRTAKQYRLYALRDTQPAKPGLVRDDGFTGPGIEIEIWSVPEDRFGSFVAGVPAPLGIGNAVMENGETVKSFICEPYAVAGSREITSFGGWRAYLARKE